MSTDLTISLPDEIYHQIQHLAQVSKRDTSDLLTDTIKMILPLLNLQAQIETQISLISDEELLSLTQLQMEAKEDSRLSDLLDKQQAGILTEFEQLELKSLMQLYQVGLLRKAQALNEAVKRGLIAPLNV